MKSFVPVLLVLCLYVSSCAATSVPSATASHFFRTTGGAFLEDIEKQTTRYFVTLEVLQSIPSDSKIIVFFDNPSGHALTQTLAIEDSKKTIAIQSEPVTGLINNGTYYVTIRIFSNDEKTLLGEHRQGILYQHFDLSRFRK